MIILFDSTGHPTISGVGFSEGGDYACLFYLPGDKDASEHGTAAFVSSTALRCKLDLDVEGACLCASSDETLKWFIQLFPCAVCTNAFQYKKKYNYCRTLRKTLFDIFFFWGFSIYSINVRSHSCSIR